MGKSPRRGVYGPSPQFIPKGLANRLSDDIWTKNGNTYDPPNGTRLHRPGSQNPRK